MSLVLDGVKAWAWAPDVPGVRLQAFTLGVWAKRASGTSSGSFPSLVQKLFSTGAGSSDYSWQIGQISTGTGHSGYVYDTSGTGTVASGSTGLGSIVDQWCLFLLRVEAGQLVNLRVTDATGAQIINVNSSAAFPGPVRYDQGALIIGRNPGGNALWTGRVGHVFLVNRRVTDTEAGTLATGGSPSALTGLVDYWPLIDDAESRVNAGTAFELVSAGYAAADNAPVAAPPAAVSSTVPPVVDAVDPLLTLDRVEAQSGLAAAVNNPVKDPSNPIIPPALTTHSIEQRKSYASVIREGTRHHLIYYARPTNTTGNYPYAAYAYSDDGGATWTRPNLGRVTLDGNTNNNIMHIGVLVAGRYEPDVGLWVLAQEHQDPYDKSGLYIYTSTTPEGPYTQVAAPPIANLVPYEGKEVVRRADGRWIGYYVAGHSNNTRRINAWASNTTDVGGAYTHLGTVISTVGSSTQKYGLGVNRVGDAYLAPVMHYDVTQTSGGDHLGIIWMDLYFSRDCLTWTRVKQQWIERGPLNAWDDGMILVGNRITQVGDTWELWYVGAPEGHEYHDPDGRRGIGKASMARGRAGQFSGTGWLETKTLTLRGDSQSLLVNANASGGSLRAELRDAAGTPLTGYTSADCDPVTTDTVEQVVTWGGKGFPTGRTDVKVRFDLTSATLYTYTVRQTTAPAGDWDGTRAWVGSDSWGAHATTSTQTVQVAESTGATQPGVSLALVPADTWSGAAFWDPTQTWGGHSARTVATPPFDPSGGQDVTADLQTWLNGLAPGTTADLGPKTTMYRINGTVTVTAKADLHIIGGTLWTDWLTADNKTMEQIVTGQTITADRTRSHLRLTDCTEITVHGVTITGPHTGGGTASEAYVVQLEAQHGIDILGGTRVTVEDCTISQVFGDFAYVGQGSFDAGIPHSVDTTIRGLHGRKNGRQGIAVTKANNTIIENCNLAEVRRAHIDLEPNTTTGVAIDGVTIRGNLFGTKRLLALASYGPGIVQNVTIDNNTYDCAFKVFVESNTGLRRPNWTITNNTSTVEHGQNVPENSSIELHRVDNIVVTGNSIALQNFRDMYLGGLEDSTVTTWSGNTVTNGSPLYYRLQTAGASPLVTQSGADLTTTSGPRRIAVAGMNVVAQPGATVTTPTSAPWRDWKATSVSVPVLRATTVPVAEARATTTAVPTARATTTDVDL